MIKKIIKVKSKLNHFHFAGTVTIRSTYFGQTVFYSFVVTCRVLVADAFLVKARIRNAYQGVGK